MNKKKKTKGAWIGLAIAIIILISIFSPSTDESKTDGNVDANNKVEDTIKVNSQENNSTDNSTTTTNTSSSQPQEISKVDTNLNLTVSFIDVGQADCILITSNDEHMLIDAGNNGDDDIILSHLNSKGVSKLKYIIGTHPHEDHIGSLDSVINAYDIETVIMPNMVSNTKTFEDVLTAIENKKLQITAPKIGDTYKLGNAEFIIIAPNKDYNEANDMSVGIKLTNGNNSFIFCGDAEENSESDIIANGIDLKADVLKLSHHGSKTGASSTFLNAINPTYAVISVGKDNQYGHPHDETLKILKDKGIKTYRTDEQGNIIATSDGVNITFNVEPSKIKISDTQQETSNTQTTQVTENKGNNIESNATYILNTNTKKFHLSTCSSVKKIKPENYQEFNGKKEDIINQGYEGCKNCNP